MIITRAPLRVSFLGGGTDKREFFEENRSVVFGASINQFVYVVSNNLSKFSDERFRFTYRISESVSQVEEIQHPVVRAALQNFRQIQSMNLSTFADIPGNTGLGSSSAFTVALLGNLREALNLPISRLDLAFEAIELERDKLVEAGGVQDQLHAAVGGLRFYELSSTAIKYSENFAMSTFGKTLNDSIFLVRVGGVRESKKFHATEYARGSKQARNLVRLKKMAVDFYENFQPESDNLSRFCYYVNESWNLKKLIDESVTNSNVERVIHRGVKAGAVAAKLCGAGHSGFVLFICPKGLRSRVMSEFSEQEVQIVELTESGFKRIGIEDRDN